MFANNQRAPEGNHHQRPENASERCNHRNRADREVIGPDIVAQEKKGWQCKDDPCSHTFPCRSACLDDVVFEDARS